MSARAASAHSAAASPPASRATRRPSPGLQPGSADARDAHGFCPHHRMYIDAWTPGSPTNILQGSVGLLNLSDYRVLPKNPYSLDFFEKEYLVIRQITDQNNK
ncbi:hypothetical protein EVAR_48447_1 [Eumeta japonica]|uniref:Uncharacterized protein n=1 Tax=Eumeta variegata TaxID=151549 RepID=A0A4C1ZUT9_EUMVA|nr:hypothetical protein EVAR_48447_1 [Eumeta japonica]